MLDPLKIFVEHSAAFEEYLSRVVSQYPSLVNED
jgi:hypothetical protein